MELLATLGFFFFYIGPGMGGGIIVAIFGILISLFLSLVAIIWYPVKKIIRILKKKNDK